jgi:type IV secretion system protein VirB9
MRKYLVFIIFAMMSLFAPVVFAADKPLAIDSRIKTIIFNENEIYRMVISYGYQSSIEFADGEEVQTVSVGNNFAWQLTPVGSRLFIKPLEENILTNMTILTNKRAYQFEIQSKNLTASLDEDLIYVLRFFYPNEDLDATRPEVTSSKAPEPTLPTIKPFNFNYVISGDAKFAPVKIFDDGINTFFKFDSSVKVLPKFFVFNNGDKIELDPRQKGEYIVLNKIAEEMNLTLKDEVIMVKNESFSRGE